jgi:poly(3-hydroxybutyrate) depolymerase
MTLLVNQEIAGSLTRSYAIEVPDSPSAEALPTIIVFDGGGQDPQVLAKRWGVDPPNPVPALLDDYLLVFPVSDPRMGVQWVHFDSDDSGFPTLDLEFVERLVAELTAPLTIPTNSATVPFVSADPDLLFAAGFSNGGGMVWQLLNSPLESTFQGFAAVGKALDPEKAQHYRATLAPTDAVPAPAPVVYIQGTADVGYRPPSTLRETPLGMTLPVFTLTEMLERNGVSTTAPATTRLVPGSTGVTEVVLQLFEGTEAFLFGTVINGGHNWPTATTRGNPPVAEHFDATEAIVDFWRTFAGLP